MILQLKLCSIVFVPDPNYVLLSMTASFSGISESTDNIYDPLKCAIIITHNKLYKIS